MTTPLTQAFISSDSFQDSGSPPLPRDFPVDKASPRTKNAQAPALSCVAQSFHKNPPGSLQEIPPGRHDSLRETLTLPALGRHTPRFDRIPGRNLSL